MNNIFTAPNDKEKLSVIRRVLQKEFPGVHFDYSADIGIDFAMKTIALLYSMTMGEKFSRKELASIMEVSEGGSQSCSAPSVWMNKSLTVCNIEVKFTHARQITLSRRIPPLPPETF